ncbi:MAG: hypothetical protein DRI90_26650 [Deltaproteobacteria bacterium]|nr:MAG: hypothetical protein DRI90_26650 [Deltaproteobacteria bacterium]
MLGQTRQRLWVLLAVCLSGLSPRLAAAQDGEAAQTSKTARPTTAAELITVADLAHRLGQYGFAIQALKQAHQTEPEPQKWLAIADAYTQRFLVKGAAYDRLQAITYYDGYLDARPRGPKSEGARRALADLESRDQTVDDEALSKARAAERQKTRLAVTASTMGATVRIDDGRAQKLPLFVFIKPGKHGVVVSAAGYQDHERQLEIAKGFAYGIDAELDPEAAKLSVASTTGAQVHIDGRFVGIAPFDEPIEVEPGKRLLLVTKHGHWPSTQQVTLKRGASHELEVDLTMTGQHLGGILLAAAGGATLFTSVVTGVLSFTNETAAQDSQGTEEGDAALARSEDFRDVSGVTLGVGLGLSLVGGILLVFDEPAVSLSPQGPGQAGATMRVVF